MLYSRNMLKFLIAEGDINIIIGHLNVLIWSLLYKLNL